LGKILFQNFRLFLFDRFLEHCDVFVDIYKALFPIDESGLNRRLELPSHAKQYAPSFTLDS